MTVAVRRADPDDLVPVMSVLDASMLAADAGTIERRIEAGTVLVAVDDDRIVGACVLALRPDGAHVEAIAVRTRRRDVGIGSALVDAATARWGRLTAAFDPDVRPFYDALGFDVERRGERCWGERPAHDGRE